VNRLLSWELAVSMLEYNTFPLLTLYFSVFFITLDGQYDRTVITVGVMGSILDLFILYYSNGFDASVYYAFVGYYTHTECKIYLPLLA